jgi:N-hydroxyarylamine O-acetyltransferase
MESPRTTPEPGGLDVTAYLDRIRYRGPLTPDAETLRRLHVAHMLAVPFENLSIHWGEPIVLDDAALFDKVVRRRRGGFCYELNGLFAALLRSLGFEVAMLSAGVMRAGGEFSPDFDHMALSVSLEERWLADVGFGDSFLEPLRLETRGEQVQTDGNAFRVDATENDRLVVMQRDESGSWGAQYRFGLEPYAYADFVPRCLYHQTSPSSHFKQRPICSLATPGGRVTLSQTRLIVTEGGERHERELAGESEYAEVLRQSFGIRAPSLPASL